MQNRFGVDSKEVKNIIKNRESNEIFKKDLFETIRKLNTLYSSDKSEEIMREEKEKIISDFESHWKFNYHINNGFLSMYGLYEDKDDRVQKFAKTFKDIKGMIDYLKPYTKVKDNPWTIVTNRNEEIKK